MEFIEITKDLYMIKDTNNYTVTREEMLKLQKNELILKDLTGCNCQGETTKAIKKIDKELENVKSNTVKKTTKSTKGHN